MRAGRLLSLLLLLQTRERMTARQLADELEVSVRTVYRDVESLSAAGVPVYADRGPDGGYRLLQGFRTRLNGLTTSEAETLFLTGMPGPASELGLGNVLAAAELKLMAALPPDLRTRAGRIRERFHLDTSGWFRTPDQAPHLHRVADAVWNHQRIQIRYRRWAHPQHVTRTLEPLGVVLKAGSWYLIARTISGSTPEADTRPEPGPEPGPERDTEVGADAAIRTYRIARVLNLDVLPQRFTRPHDFDLATYWQHYTQRFEADSYRDRAEILLTPQGRHRAAHLLPPTMARAIAAHPAPDEPDDRTHATVPVESVRHAHVELLKLGADVEVLSPPELRRLMTDTAHALTALYSSPDTPAPPANGTTATATARIPCE
ncbi:helix-turn-helix transcriptional regulator [Spirillospora sp. NBC_01491]|uniref:helix-turn-helix transcriptional regulator n=1 Tax=Spirillospora sp. NBC_01491 TaxID=2976007 RepID=UPI002E376ED8|nr:WYL domain-containing protein [Spirillospora sp. NBC_01491]